MTYSLEPCFKVYDDSSGTFLEVRVDPTIPDCILIHTPNKDSKEFYGDIRLTLSEEQSLLLANAINRQIKLMDELGE